MGNRLYVGNLNTQTNAEDLTLLFSGAGVVVRSQVVVDRDTGISKGFGFVEMEDEAGVRQAIQMYNGHWLANHALRVSQAHERSETPVTQTNFRPDPKKMPQFKQIKHKSRGGANKRRF